MNELPKDVQAVLTRAFAAYLRATPASRLPPALRPVGRFGARALAAHRATLWDALEDEGLRALILEWLDGGRVPVARSEAGLLRLACERPAGWKERLAESSELAAEKPRGDAPRGNAEATERVRRARDEARRAREGARQSVAVERTRALEAERAAAAWKARLEEAQDALKEREREQKVLQDALEAERRRVRRARERASRASEEARDRLRESRKEVARLRRALRRSEDRAEAATRSRGKPVARHPAGARTPLPVPLGRPGDDPETLDDWLQVPGVQLLVDGYNVTKAEGGFGELDLWRQRERLMEEIEALARRKGIRATLVFDGARQAPGKARRARSSITVEYSRPDEEADDHLIARLEALSPDPVVIVTNDRELQDRARPYGATVAGSAQLLALIRGGPRR